MKTERELFEAWAKKETNWDLYWSENIKQYMDHQTNGAWYAWQEQQKKIDGALKELELLNYYRTGNSDNAIKILKGADK